MIVRHGTPSAAVLDAVAAAH